MNSKHDAFSPDPLRPVSDAQASKLLRLAKSGAREDRPVDHLVERLRLPDGGSWIEAALGRSDEGSREGAKGALLGGEGLDRILTIKEQGTSTFRAGDDEDQRLAGLAAYFAAVASALAHHRRLITGRKPKEVKEVLLALAAAMPSPWDDLFRRGAEACSGATRTMGSNPWS